MRNWWTSRYPGPLGKADEVAKAVIDAGDNNPYMTAQSITMSGGMALIERT